MMLGSVFLDVAVIRHDRAILRDNVCCVSLRSKQRLRSLGRDREHGESHVLKTIGF